MTDPQPLNFFYQPWHLDPVACPCDVDLVDYLQREDIRGKSVFHFGTGAHHLLGCRNHQLGLQNHILGLTASPEEFLRYTDLIEADGALFCTYKVLLGDVYALSPLLLPPNLDLVTMFHLGEFEIMSYACFDDSSILQLFISKMLANARLCIYPKSCGRGRAAAAIQQAISQKQIVLTESHRSIDIYRRI